MEWQCRCLKPSIAGHCTAQTGSFTCLFGCSLLTRPLHLGSQWVGSPSSVVSLIIQAFKSGGGGGGGGGGGNPIPKTTPPTHALYTQTGVQTHTNMHTLIDWDFDICNWK